MSAEKPLEGIRVLTLEQVHSLPWGTAWLADLGADVIRVESLDHMQDRKNGPYPDGKPTTEWWNEGGNLAYYGLRNKRSLCLDVTTDAGRDAFLSLVKVTDIVTDNFRPGTMLRLGLDHESLKAVNPGIITLSVTAYGHTGPWRRAGSRARTVDASCGLSYLTGYEGGPSKRASSNYMDHSVGNNVAWALLLALYKRSRTGQSVRVDLSMEETGVASIGPAILEAEHSITRPRLGCAHLWKAPHNVYPTQGDDRWIVIVAASDAEWDLLKEAMANPSWAAAKKFDTILGRRKYRHELDDHISEWTRTRDDIELMTDLQRRGILAASALTAEDLSCNEHLEARAYLHDYANPNYPAVGVRRYAGRPFKSPGLDLQIQGVARLGEHNEDVLRGVGGLSDAEIQELAMAGVIAGAPRPDEPAP